jgi:hypothetical protein
VFDDEKERKKASLSFASIPLSYRFAGASGDFYTASGFEVTEPVTRGMRNKGISESGL